MLRGNLSTHLNKAKAECDLYNNLSRVSSFSEQNILHLIMDLAQKSFFLSLVKKPMQLHFITGLEVD